MARQRTGVSSPATSTEGRPFRRRIVLNTLSTTVGNGWAMVVMFASLPLLLRGLGTEAFGLWVLLQTFSAVNGWFSLADAGIGLAMTRAVASRGAVDDREGIGEAVGSGVAGMFGIGVFAAILLAVLGPLGLPRFFRVADHLVGEFRTAIVVFALTVLLDLLIRAAGAALEGLQRVDLARASDGLRRTAAAAAMVMVALGGGGLRGVAIANALASIAALLITAAILRRQLARYGRPRTMPNRGVVVDLLRYGSTVAALNTTGVLHRVMDRLIVGAMFGPHGVTLIEVATQLQNGASAVLSATSYAAMSSSPWLQARQDRDALRALVVRGTRYSMLASIPVVALAALLSRHIIRAWVGEGFDEASGLAVLALLYIALASPLQVGQNVLQGIGRASLVLRPALVSVAVNLIASVVLARAFGLVGVMIGTLAGMIVLLPYLLRSILKETATPLRTMLRSGVAPSLAVTVLPTLAAAVVAARVVAPSWQIVVLSGVVGLALYVPGVLAWGLHPDDRRGLLRRLRRAAPPAPSAES